MLVIIVCCVLVTELCIAMCIYSIDYYECTLVLTMVCILVFIDVLNCAIHIVQKKLERYRERERESQFRCLDHTHFVA